MHRFLHRTLVIVCILFAVGLLLSYLSVYINPEKIWILGLVGLSYPFLLAFNVFFLAYWIIRWKRLFLIPLLTILIGANHIFNFVQLPLSNKADTIKPEIKLLSYNVNLFRLYSWSNQSPSFNNIAAFTKKNNANIICLQEYYWGSNKLSENQALALFNMNSHIEYSLHTASKSYGIATFTKFHIVNKGELKFENTSNACIYTDLKIGDDTIRVYNCHLQSIRLRERNLNFLMNQEHHDESSTVSQIKDISFKYRDALKKRAHQVNMLVAHMNKCKYPVIVCGDFNDSPFSYTYHKLTHKLYDTFKEAGKGLANTYVRFFPYRIDYILHSNHFKGINFSSPRVDYSDHFPVIGSFSIKK